MPTTAKQKQFYTQQRKQAQKDWDTAPKGSPAYNKASRILGSLAGKEPVSETMREDEYNTLNNAKAARARADIINKRRAKNTGGDVKYAPPAARTQRARTLSSGRRLTRPTPPGALDAKTAKPSDVKYAPLRKKKK